MMSFFTIQYIQPYEHQKLSQVEPLVIDEEAAIPLPVLKSLLGPYIVFLSLTVSGYEGTGRSLSLKLLQQLDEHNRTPPATSLVGFSFSILDARNLATSSAGFEKLIEDDLTALFQQQG
ncbi:PREDICTED: RNA cytidine acetyltransferase 2-like isoform X2 [Camelina sativa]|uniref:RNA cytidine acetyltransferase 2-like isoform X2 n=1 Tax=Camelina sativa TaxID=90675 RepID=A0ABM0W2S1_CAMSA|nr:PREDICTED: RNA cytidine acetyltransferase 2-like isoform X2 [Camelina sativa]